MDKTYRFVLRDYIVSFLFVAAMLMGAFVLYRGPEIFGLLMQLLILALFMLSKKDWIWFATFAFISFSPGLLFYDGFPRSLVILKIPFIGVLSFNMVFSALALIKGLYRNKAQVVYRNQWFILLFYMILLIPMYGGSLTYLIKGFLNYSLWLSVPLLMYTKEDYDNFFLLAFAANVLVLISFLIEITTGDTLVSYIYGMGQGSTHERFSSMLTSYQGLEEFYRPTWGIDYSLVSIIAAMYYTTNVESPFSNTYVNAMLFMGILSIILSATRGWMVALAVIISMYLIVLLPRLTKRVLIGIPVLLILLSLSMQIPVISFQVEQAIGRLLISESVIQGEFSVEATGGRAQTGGIVFSKYLEKPIFGWGYGSEAMDYVNVHTGNQTMLLQFGLIGFLLCVLIWIRLYFGIYRSSKYLSPSDQGHKITHLMPVLYFISIFIIHSTSGIRLHPFTGGMSVALMFGFGNYIYYSLREN